MDHPTLPATWTADFVFGNVVHGMGNTVMLSLESRLGLKRAGTRLESAGGIVNREVFQFQEVDHLCRSRKLRLDL